MTSANTRPRIRYLLTGENPVQTPGSVSGNDQMILSYRRTIAWKRPIDGIWVLDLRDPEGRTTAHHMNCVRDVFIDLHIPFAELTKEGFLDQ